MKPTQNSISYDANNQQLLCQGDFSIATLPHLQSLFAKVAWPKSGTLHINGQDIQKMDSAGAWLLIKLQKKLKTQGLTVQLQKFSEQYQSLISLIAKDLQEEAPLPTVTKPNWLAVIGERTISQLNEVREYLSFVGELTIEGLRLFRHPHRMRFKALASTIYRAGFQGLPIIAVLSFMIGVVLTYQMGLQLRNYGANIYIVDLLGLAVLREFGPLITAIMVAGRTGSAFTAQLGMMMLNQEIDALDTMGITPAELLLLPRIIGMVIVLPLLTIWSDIFGVLGGMVMSNTLLDISWHDFLHRFPTVIPLKSLLIGLGKAPVFGLIIASIGCFQGIQVKLSADSVGRNTTKSVVLSIFFILVADALFSVLFSELKL